MLTPAPGRQTRPPRASSAAHDGRHGGRLASVTWSRPATGYSYDTLILPLAPLAPGRRARGPGRAGRR